MKFTNSLVLLTSLLSTAVVIAAEAPTDAVLGSYQDMSLTEQDLLHEIEDVRAAKKIAVDPDRKVIFTLVDHLLLRRALAREAEEKDLIPRDDLEARLQRQREIWLSQARLDSLVRELTPEELETAARELYTAHKEEYMTDETVDVSHILLRARGEGREEAATLALASDLHAQLVADPSRFEALAKEYSEDPKTAEKGGGLGVQATKRLVKPFKDAALALEPGAVSAPVKTQFGFHIIRLNALTPSEQMPFDKVKSALMAQAQKQARQSAISTYMSKIKSSEDFHYDEAAVQRFFDQRFAHEAKSPGKAK